MVAKEGCERSKAIPMCSTPVSVAKAGGRRMSGAEESGLQPTEADLCNPQTCSGLLGGLLLLLLADTAGTACCTTCSCIQEVGGSIAASRAGQCGSKCAQASCYG